MEREFIQTFLRKSGMQSAQAEALSHILSEMATKSDLRALGEKLEGSLKVMDAKFSAMDQKLDGSLKVMDAKFSAMDQKLESSLNVMDGRLATMEEKQEKGLQSLKAELTWRFFGAVIALAALMTVLDRVFG